MNAADLYTLASEKPWLVFGLALLLVYGLGELVSSFFRLLNRITRHLNIRKAGWPPPHCDADGDAVEQDKPDAATASSALSPLSEAFGRDDVEILRVDGTDPEMPFKITVRVGEKTGVFVRSL